MHELFLHQPTASRLAAAAAATGQADRQTDRHQADALRLPLRMQPSIQIRLA